MQKDRIAIIGVGCRFPGGVSSKDSLWKLLVEGREGIIEVPPDRWNVERYYDAEPGVAGKSIALRGGFIDAIDQFDPQFFGISPREAPYVDPQHRLLLETAWEAIEDAGLVLDFERGADLGVFVGISHNDYQGIQSTSFDHFSIGPHTPTGSAHSIAANRISYCLNLRGPSVAMDTACSSALTAVHAACEHIWAGRGDVALAGGVTVMISPGGFIGFSQAAMLSPEGRCAAFDASASGFVRGEGAGMVLLRHGFCYRALPGRAEDLATDGDQVGTTGLTYITNNIQPTAQPKVFDTLSEAASALAAHRIDALVTDTPTAPYMASAQLKHAVLVAQFPPVGEHYGLLFHLGNPLVGCG